jgi:hypothetical protein
MSSPSRLESHKDCWSQVTPCCTIMFHDNSSTLSSVSRSLLSIPNYGSTFHEPSMVSWISPIHNSMNCIPELRRRQNKILENHSPLIPDENASITCQPKRKNVCLPTTELTIKSQQSTSLNCLFRARSMEDRSGMRLLSSRFSAPSTSPDRRKKDRTTEYTNASSTTLRIANLEVKTPMPEIAFLKRNVAKSPLRTLHSVHISETRIGCACKKSKCLKLYCDCFAGQFLCSEETCKCVSCSNRHENDEQRRQAIYTALQKDILVFEKRTQSRTERDRNMLVTKSNARISCRCKRSRCVMKYCECFSAAALCDELCRCSGCRNLE